MLIYLAFSFLFAFVRGLFSSYFLSAYELKFVIYAYLLCLQYFLSNTPEYFLVVLCYFLVNYSFNMVFYIFLPASPQSYFGPLSSISITILWVCLTILWFKNYIMFLLFWFVFKYSGIFDGMLILLSFSHVYVVEACPLRKHNMPAVRIILYCIPGAVLNDFKEVINLILNACLKWSHSYFCNWSWDSRNNWLAWEFMPD